MNLAQKLNNLNAMPVVKDGKVVGLDQYVDDDYDETAHIPDDVVESLGLSPGNLGCVKEHPEGSDRGGYVPTVTLPEGVEPDNKWYRDTYFDEHDSEWR